jgi:hypothetical protein
MVYCCIQLIRRCEKLQGGLVLSRTVLNSVTMLKRNYISIREGFVVTVIQRPSRKAIDQLLTLGVAQIVKEADLRRLLLEGNNGEPFTLKENYFFQMDILKERGGRNASLIFIPLFSLNL